VPAQSSPTLLVKHQLLILNRSRKKAPKLRALDRILLGLGAMLVSPQRILRVAVVGRPSSDAARLHANRRIFITLLGDPTVPASSTHQLLRNQEFAMVTSAYNYATICTQWGDRRKALEWLDTAMRFFRGR
jgi:hypothetical protein